MKSIMIIAFCLAVIFGYLNLGNESDEYNDTVVSNRASMFMIYASTFDSFYLANPSANGEVTSKVSLRHGCLLITQLKCTSNLD